MHRDVWEACDGATNHMVEGGCGDFSVNGEEEGKGTILLPSCRPVPPLLAAEQCSSYPVHCHQQKMHAYSYVHPTLVPRLVHVQIHVHTLNECKIPKPYTCYSLCR